MALLWENLFSFILALTMLLSWEAFGIPEEFGTGVRGLLRPILHHLTSLHGSFLMLDVEQIIPTS